MTIITISRGSYSMGKAVAERVAERLGYECLSRDVLLEASDQFNIEEIKLEQAIKDAPSILERFTQGKHSYIAYIQSALTRHVCRDNVVYHGLAGHLLLGEVPHVLKVRIIADPELRMKVVMDREKLNRREAGAWIGKLDRARSKWGRSLYGVEPGDPALFDLLLNVPRYEVDDATELICRSAEMKQFKTTPDSQQQMEDLALACRVKATLVERHSDVSVASKYGNVLIYCDAGDRYARKLKASAEELCGSIEGVNNIEVHCGVTPPDSAV
jgi:cytidylate kinase